MKGFSLRRIIVSINVATVIAFFALLVAAVRQAQQSGAVNWSIYGLGALGLLLIGLQTYANRIIRQYDPTLAFKLQDLLHADETREVRARGARHFQKTGRWNRDVEAALDVIEDVGFYVENDVIGVEVAHHHFYHWVRGYVQTADDYIANYRRKEPLAYEWAGRLLERLTEYESRRSQIHVGKLVWDQLMIDEFIKGEIEEGEDSPPSDEPSDSVQPGGSA